MSGANGTAHSSTGSSLYDDSSYEAPYLSYRHPSRSPHGYSPESTGSESDEIDPADSASRSSIRNHSHNRYPDDPAYHSSHEADRFRVERLPHKTHHHRPPVRDHHSHSQPPSGRHHAYPASPPPSSDFSDHSASLDPRGYASGYAARGSFHDSHYDAHFQDPYWSPETTPYSSDPSVMTSSTPSTAQYPMGDTMIPYNHYAYASQANPYMAQQSPGNPFVTSLPHAPSPQSGYFYDQHSHTYQQRPDMMVTRGMHYPPPPDLQYMGAGVPRPWTAHPDLMAAQMAMYRIPPSIHQTQPSTPAPSEKPPAKPEKKPESPPPVAPAPPPPPPPTAEEIKKQKEEEAAIQAASMMKALRMIHDEEKAKEKAANVEKEKVQAESDKIASLLQQFEKDRLAREEAIAKQAAADKAAAEAKAAREKELADAATAARDAAEKEASAKAATAKAESEKQIAEAKAEHEKKMAEAKAAADAAEAAKKAAEEELKKNAPEPDANKAAIKFTDAVERNFTLPWHLAKTWKGMEALIKQAFVNIEHIGPHVANGHYHLIGPNNEIILPQVWEILVQPGWEIKMQLWPFPEPVEEKVPAPPGAFVVDTPVVMVPPKQPKPGSKGTHKVSGSKSASKRASIGPTPMPPPIHHASPPPPPTHVPVVMVGHDNPDDPIVEVITDNGGGRGGAGTGPKPKHTANSSKKKQVPAFTKWMLGGTRSRSKGNEKPAAGAKGRRVIVEK